MPDLPSPVSVFKDLASAVFSWLGDIAVIQTLRDAMGMVAQLVKWVVDGWQGLVTKFDREQRAVYNSLQYAEQIGHDFEQIEGSQEATLNHVVYTVLPNSLSYVVGYMVSKWIAPLQAEMHHDEQLIADNAKALSALWAWLFPYASDAIKGYYQFVQWWDQNFSTPAATLIDWLKHPGNFAAWAAPPLAGALVAYYGDPQHEQTRDDLTRVMVQAWAETPERVFDAVTVWLVTDKGS